MSGKFEQRDNSGNLFRISDEDIASGHDFLANNERAMAVFFDLSSEIDRLTEALERVAPGRGSA